MFELPEYVILARQMNGTIRGKTIERGCLGNSPHKFLWYNRSHEEFEELTRGKIVGEAYSRGRWLFVPLKPGYMLLFGECGGKVLYHEPGAKRPAKYHLCIDFQDGSFLTAMTQMWGAMELYAEGEELEREYVKGMRPTPVDAEFTFAYFDALVDEAEVGKKRSAKALLTQEQLIPGLGNAIAQDILFKARLHPRYPVAALDAEERRVLYGAIQSTVQDVIERGGRYDETNLFGQSGGYVRLMDKNAVKRPCPNCGGTVEKINYLGGACYLCPSCQE